MLAPGISIVGSVLQVLALVNQAHLQVARYFVLRWTLEGGFEDGPRNLGVEALRR
jgi:hypothetical protein